MEPVAAVAATPETVAMARNWRPPPPAIRTSTGLGTTCGTVSMGMPFLTAEVAAGREVSSEA